MKAMYSKKAIPSSGSCKIAILISTTDATTKPADNIHLASEYLPPLSLSKSFQIFTSVLSFIIDIAVNS